MYYTDMDTDSPIVNAFRNYMLNERGLAESTVATYGHHVKTYLAFLKGRGCPAAKATPAHVVAHIGALRARGLQSATLFCAGMAIRAFHFFMLAKGHSPHDPTVGLESPKITSRIPEPLAVDEIEHLLASWARARASAWCR